MRRKRDGARFRPDSRAKVTITSVHLIAGFDSQIVARGAVGGIVRAASEAGMTVDGVALVRRDTDRGVHVDTVRGYRLPAHVLKALDGVVEGDVDAPTLAPGQAALVVATGMPPGGDLSRLVVLTEESALDALWVTVTDPNRADGHPTDDRRAP